MNKLPHITEIIKVEPFKITVRWTTGEIRVIDFEQLFQQWDVQPDEPEAAPFDYDTFKYASVADGKTLHWVNVTVEHLTFNDNAAEKQSSPLSFDPDVLYEVSRPIEEFRLVPIDTQL
ncbi:hypothetical protein [Spirosoma arcticum]